MVYRGSDQFKISFLISISIPTIGIGKTGTFMKKWISRIVVFVGLLLATVVPVVAQNTLSTLGLTSSTPAAAAYSLRKLMESI